MNLNKKIIYSIISLLSVVLITTIFINKKISTKDLNIPTLQIKTNSKEINAFISSYDYNKKIKYLAKYNNKNYSLTVAPSNEIKLEFIDIPHEYSIQIIDDFTSVEINDYIFKSPEKKGSYTYSVNARWYDKGDIVYKFTINVE